MVGEIRWFNNSKGCGFIKRPKGRDVWVFFSNIEDDGRDHKKGGMRLYSGDQVEYELGTGYGNHRVEARNVRVVAKYDAVSAA